MEDRRLQTLDGRRNFRRRTFVQTTAMGAIGGLLGLKILRFAGFGKKGAARRPSKSRIQVKPNPLAVPRMKEKT
jgi:hypothetical protein